jgi:FkbM family methyltransferase
MKRIINRALRRWLPIRLKHALIQASTRNLLECTLLNLRDNGYQPDVIIDVGAFEGSWTKLARQVFHRPSVLMIEAQPEKEATLRAASTDAKVTYRVALLGAAPSDGVRFYKMRTGSSVYAENTGVARQEVTMPMTTLNHVVRDAGLLNGGSTLLKLDVQGSEIEILRGAAEVLPQITAVIAEVSLVNYNLGAPQFAEITQFMREQGFVVYDIAGMRRFGKMMGQLDIIFLRDDSPLRMAWQKKRRTDSR